MANWVVRTQKTARRTWKLGYSGRSGVGGINAISPPTTCFSSIRSASSKFTDANRPFNGSGNNKVGGVFPASLRCFCSFAALPTTLQHHHEEGEEPVPAPAAEPERSKYPVLLVPRPKNQMREEDVVEDAKDDEYYHYFHLADFEENEVEGRKPPKVSPKNQMGEEDVVEDGKDDEYYDHYVHLADLEENEEEEEEERKPPKVRKIKKNKIPGVPSYDCVGSSHGWLAFLDHNNSSINFVNPLIHSDHIRKSFRLQPVPFCDSANNLEGGAVPFVQRVRLSSPPKIPGPPCHLDVYKHIDGTWWTPGGSDGFCEYSGVPFVRKVALSSTPYEDSSYTAAAIHGSCRHLAFYTHEDGTWWTPGGVGDYSDVIFSRKDGLFYAIRNPQPNDMLTDIRIQAWDPFSHQSTLIHPCLRKLDIQNKYIFGIGEFDEKRYLVESSPSCGGGGGGDLYLVLRYICNCVDEIHGLSPVFDPEDYDPELFMTYKTFFFKAYKLNRDANGMCCWEAVDDLDGQSFFVGMNHSFSVPDAHLHYPMLRKDHIYYSDDCFDKMHLYNSDSGGHDNGVSPIDDHKTGVIYNGDLSKYQPPPIWLDVLSQPPLVS